MSSIDLKFPDVADRTAIAGDAIHIPLTLKFTDVAHHVRQLKAELALFKSPERFARLNADLIEAEAIIEALAEAKQE